MRYRTAAFLAFALPLAACAQYQLAMPPLEMPNYEPRVVDVPATCDPLIARAATQGMSLFTETEAREVLFCQQQQIIRTQEEEAAAKRLEAHAEAARFGLQVITVLLTATVAILAWVF
jgi:hypothetical protein